MRPRYSTFGVEAVTVKTASECIAQVVLSPIRASPGALSVAVPPVEVALSAADVPALPDAATDRRQPAALAMKTTAAKRARDVLIVVKCPWS